MWQVIGKQFLAVSSTKIVFIVHQGRPDNAEDFFGKSVVVETFVEKKLYLS